MMTALATVTGVNASDKGYQLDLSCQQQTSCNHCSSAKTCGTGLVSNALGNKVLRWQLNTTSRVQKGQVVEIGFPEKSLLQSAALVYLLPLFMLFIGALVGQYWLVPLVGGGEVSIIICSFVFITLGVLLAKKMSKGLELRTQTEVILIRIIGEPIVTTMR